MNLLLTGPPGCGKTTLVARVVEGLRGRVRPAGFLTEEVREGGDRVGFDIVTMDGRRASLSRKGGWQGRGQERGHGRGQAQGPRVGRYRVDLASLEAVAVPSLVDADAGLFVVDEIGLMELASPAFRAAVLELLDDPRPLIATIRWKREAFCDALKARPDVEVIGVTRENRDGLAGDLVQRTLDDLAQG